MSKLLFIFLLIPNVVYSWCKFPDRVIHESAKYLDVRELTNKNDGPEVEKFLLYLGLPKGNPWCAAYVVYCYREAADAYSIKNPLPKYGRVSTIWWYAEENELRYKTIDSEDVLSGAEKLIPADIVIWESKNFAKKKNFNGHTGLVLFQKDNNKFKSREGNTTAGDDGDQREGGGVYDRNRSLAIGTSFAVVGFIRIRE